MNIIRLAFEIFLIYILYKLVFDFIIPVYQTTRRVKKQFGEMHDKMQEQMNKFNEHPSAANKKTSHSSDHNEEYINFEEVK